MDSLKNRMYMYVLMYAGRVIRMPDSRIPKHLFVCMDILKKEGDIKAVQN